MTKLNGKSKDITKDNIKKIKELFPSIDTDGKIDFDKLRLLLDNEIEESPDKYNFTWNGKGKSIRLAQTPSTGTLRPDRETSINFDETENIYIEGDNLEVLKLLQKTYYNKIKMIYIDPPYNTGKDFVYKDNFRDNISNYKEQTNQSSQANPETSGRYHTDWLNMMYPRLMLARNLLSDDGAIFISIDETEHSRLILLCNEIFGESNQVGSIVWKNRTTPNDSKTNFATIHEYILIYAKNIDNIYFQGIDKDLSNYRNPDNDPMGNWISDNPSAASGNEKMLFPILNPFTGEEYFPPNGRYWAFSEKRIEEWTKSGKLVFPRETGKRFVLKKYLTELKRTVNSFNSIYDDALTMHGTKEIREIFSDIQKAFDYPKPTKLIGYLLNFFEDDSFIALDFFSGSATLGDAVFQNNHTNNKKIKFILVQLPEKTDEKSDAYSIGLKTLSDIGRERLRRVGIKYDKFDTGFKSYILDSSNIIPWDSSIKPDEQTLFDSIEVFKEERNEEDILYEILLKTGTFDQRVEKISINNKLIYSIGNGYSIVCLIDDVTLDDIKEIGKLKPAKVVFKENGFKDDNVKLNSIHTLISLGVKELQTI